MTLPEIAIFDANFVARNVHAGEFVSRDHRANLLQVIIGKAGVALAETVNKLDDTIRDKNGETGRARKAVQQHLPGSVKLDDFLALANDPEIDAKIAAKTTERDAARRAEEIKARASLTEATIPEFPTTLTSMLAKTLSDVSADAENRLKAQIARHEMYEHGEAWLSEGLGYIREDECPFCGQSTWTLTSSSSLMPMMR